MVERNGERRTLPKRRRAVAQDGGTYRVSAGEGDAGEGLGAAAGDVELGACLVELLRRTKHG